MKQNPIKRALCVLLAVLVLILAIPAVCILSSFGGRGNPDANYLIVLGTTVNGTEPSPMLRQRLDAALAYLNEHPHTQCIVTGGKGGDGNLPEAACMYNYLIAAGIEPHRVWTEDRATSTIENLRNTRSLIQEETGVEPGHVAILSSDFHLFRAGLMARDLDLDAALIPAKTGPFPTLAGWFLREIFALWVYLFSGT